jgi:tetratricopeptide (TPR) repeat protein
MGFFQRLFSTEYRKAVAAEAAGDFLAAARSYALCGELNKVTDMHLAHARRERSLDGRIRSLRNALQFAADDDQRHRLVKRLLGEALQRRGRRLGARTGEGREALLEAGEQYLGGALYEVAGECFLEAGEVDQAVDAFSHAGLVERVDKLLTEIELERSVGRRLEERFKDYEIDLAGGRRDEALSALRTCAELAGDKGQYRRLLRELEQRILHDGHVALLNEGEQTDLFSERLKLGRDVGAGLIVRGPSVSRRHCQIGYAEQEGFWLEDCGSKNGTLLGQLSIANRIPLPPSAEIGLGDSVMVESQRLEGSPCPALRLEVKTGMDRGSRAILLAEPQSELPLLLLGSSYPDGTIRFRDKRPFLRPLSSKMTLNGSKVGDAIQLIAGDEVSDTSGSLRVPD